ncbi:sensor histidine kinase [Nesterenkonia sandarakina]|uniref:Signal transduction histidine kinase n=1 Tax=Nesterenkonia sandarakina TaxID=272918 RepID=A0A7Z0J283_9MICC|nr:GAF domain-containing protein [Nesterenkonia sandarakina]NYJ15995.1 signal transduction histidine kinase [Nesterenkonia sandarakina]
MQSRFQNLLAASQLVTGELDLEQVLRQIAESAVTLVNAQYGALGVIDPDGHLERFIHVGIPADLVDRIGHLPEGHGVLGAVIDAARPIRLPNLNTDPRAVGFPEHHPPMDSFLGVPITIHGETFGNLYLTNRSGGPFTAEDEDLVTALATTAATAINNARVYGEARRAQRLSAALGEVTSALLASNDADVFGVLTQSVASLTGAQLVSVVVCEAVGRELYVDTARGDQAAEVEGTSVPWMDCVISRAMEGEPGMTPEGEDEPVPFAADIPSASMIAVPLVISGDRMAALCATRSTDQAPFHRRDLELLSEFAAQAGLAVALVWSRADQQRLEMVEERTRIARDLHDHVIQRLFGTGLGLEALASTYPHLATSIDTHVTQIDAAIADIRAAIFALQTQAPFQNVRHRLLEVMTELSPRLSTIPRLIFTGPVDLILEGALADDAVAVLRESLSNVARHAQAETVSVEITATEAQITITVDDDGIGVPSDSTRRSGTKNLSARAQAWGGDFTLSPRIAGGTRALWQAPVGSEVRP